MSVLQVDTIRDRSGNASPTLDKGVVVSGASTLGFVKVVPGTHGAGGIITATSGIVTFFGDAQYMSNVGLAVTFIDNNVTIAGTVTVNELVLTGGGGLGGGAGIAASTINISGISTLGGISINAGIITAGPGVTTVRYFGDGGGLTRLMAEHLLVHQRSATGRFILGQNIVQIALTNNPDTQTGTFPITARTGIVTTSYGKSGQPSLSI
jgi:hypothetical protein